MHMVLVNRAELSLLSTHRECMEWQQCGRAYYLFGCTWC